MNYYDSFFNFSKTKFPQKNQSKADKNLESEFQALKNINFAELIIKYARQYLNLQTYVALNIPDAKNFSKISKEGSFKSQEMIIDIENINFNNNEESIFKIQKRKIIRNLFNFFKKKPIHIILIVFIIIVLFILGLIL